MFNYSTSVTDVLYLQVQAAKLIYHLISPNGLSTKGIDDHPLKQTGIGFKNWSEWVIASKIRDPRGEQKNQQHHVAWFLYGYEERSHHCSITHTSNPHTRNS